MAKLSLVIETDASGAITGLRQLGSAAEGAGKKVTKLQQFTQNAFKGAGIAAGFAALRTFQAVPRELAQALGEAIAAAGNFDRAMIQSTAVMGRLSDDMRDRLAKQARFVGVEMNLGASKAGEGFRFLAAAGFDAEQSLTALPTVAQFAKAGMFDLAVATDLATDAQSALGLTSTDAVENQRNLARVTDTLVNAYTLANASVSQFSEALTNKAAAAARNAGVEIEEVVAVLAAMADQGIKGAAAGEKFSIFLRELDIRARENAEAFKGMNIEVFDAQGNFNSLGGIIGQMEKALDGMSVAQKGAALSSLGFQQKQIDVIKTLLGTSEAITGMYLPALNASAGKTQEVSDQVMSSFAEQVGQLQRRFEDIQISIGSLFIPAMREIGTVVGESAADVQEWADALNDPSDGLGLMADLAKDAADVIRGLNLVVKEFAAGAKGFANHPIFRLLGGGKALAGAALSAIPGGADLQLLAQLGQAGRPQATQKNQLLKLAGSAIGISGEDVEGVRRTFERFTQELIEEQGAVEELGGSVDNLGSKAKKAATLTDLIGGRDGGLFGAVGRARESAGLAAFQGLTRQIAEGIPLVVPGLQAAGGGAAANVGIPGIPELTADDLRLSSEPDFAVKGITDSLSRLERPTQDWSRSLQDLANAFSLFGDPGRKFGQLAAGILSVNTSLETFKQGKAAGGFGGILGQVAGGLGLAGSVIGAIGGLFGGGKKKREEEERRRQETLESALGQLDSLQRELDEFRNAKIAAGVSGVTSLLAGIGEEAELTQERFDRLQRFGAASLAQLRAEGLSTAEALKQLSPALNEAVRVAQEQGLELSGTFGALADFADRVAQNEGLVSGVEALNQVLEAARATGGLDQEFATDVQAELAGFAEQLAEKGFAANEILALTAPTLLQLRDAAAAGRIELDELTLAMIAQAEASGAFEGVADPMERMLEIQQLMLEVITAVAKVFGADLPESVQAYIASIRQIPTDIPTPSFPGGPTGDFGDEPGISPIQAASGFHSDSMPIGPLTGGGTPLVAHPGEKVDITPRGERGGRGGNVSVSANPVFTITVNGGDPRDLIEAMRGALPEVQGELQEMARVAAREVAGEG